MKKQQGTFGFFKSISWKYLYQPTTQSKSLINTTRRIALVITVITSRVFS